MICDISLSYGSATILGQPEVLLDVRRWCDSNLFPADRGKQRGKCNQARGNFVFKAITLWDKAARSPDKGGIMAQPRLSIVERPD